MAPSPRATLDRRLAPLAAMLALVLGLPAVAHANGDPPSDVLPTRDVYLPFGPVTSDGAARALLELAGRTRADGWPIKIAIIATPSDLGDVSNLFAHPQQYADFLGRELRNPRLLVVTPVGFGGRMLGRGVDALSALAPVAAGNDRLERQALGSRRRTATTSPSRRSKRAPAARDRTARSSRCSGRPARPLPRRAARSFRRSTATAATHRRSSTPRPSRSCWRCSPARCCTTASGAGVGTDRPRIVDESRLPAPRPERQAAIASSRSCSGSGSGSGSRSRGEAGICFASS